MKKFKIRQEVICGFPGTGKSRYIKSSPNNILGHLICDNDSSKFNKSEFPENYIKHIKEKINEGYARIFISSHKEVREALISNGIEFVLVYPKK